MSTFKRDFPVFEISGALDANTWFADLLRCWQPAGSSATGAQDNDRVANGSRNLRLAVRDGYLNMYQGGQSVALVTIRGRQNLRAEIHEKYIHGEEATGQKCISVTSDGYLDRSGARRAYAGMSDLETWIANAKRYGGGEKAFVEKVVSRNENVIDLEMALPAYLEDATERNAPRMDLVALERDGSTWKIVFWEAKLGRDRRARCSGDGDPEVCRQLESYTRWLAHGDHHELVKIAYTKTCKVLVGLHEIAKSINPDIAPLGEAIMAIASGSQELLRVDDKPRLLIDAREPDQSFTKNGHLQKLRGLGLHVQMVQEGGDMRLEAV